jgi:hypothetical protein
MFPPILRSLQFVESALQPIHFRCGDQALFRCLATVTRILRQVMDLAAVRVICQLQCTRAAGRFLQCLPRLGCPVPEDYAGQSASALRTCLQLRSTGTVARRSRPLWMGTALHQSVFLLRDPSPRAPMLASGPARRQLDTNLPAREVFRLMVPSRTRSAKPAIYLSSLLTRAVLAVVVAPSCLALSAPYLLPKSARSLQPLKAAWLPLIPSLTLSNRAPSADFETDTVCPPLTEYDDATKCISPPSVEEIIESQTY